jgi:hypothetical protein
VRDERQRVVILYAHPLLGEGIARLLADDPGLTVELAEVDGDVSAALRALSGSPDVVILERSAPVEALDLFRAAPSALFIDVGLDTGPSWTLRRDELSPQPEEILRAIHQRRGTRRAARVHRPHAALSGAAREI